VCELFVNQSEWVKCALFSLHVYLIY